MNRYKIEVKNKEQADEAQELFSQLGFNKDICSDDRYPKLVVTKVDYSCGAPINYSESSECEGLSFDQLRSLVSLHKNPINMDKVLNEVRSDALGLLDDEPIKKTIKELLLKDKSENWHYNNSNMDSCPAHVEAIEIPEGAEFLTECFDNGELFRLWWKGEYKICIGYDEDWFNIHRDVGDYLEDQSGSKVVWQRHTQPEELPFVDDEPPPNDQYAEIEQVRQNTVQNTLNERESTYGSFTGVANTTGQLMGVLLNSKNGQTLPYVHQEALHMICSKMARIVNGDHNHKDSWHDIAGYATLIERL